VNRTTKIGQESKPEIRQQLIGIVAHQCHETFDTSLPSCFNPPVKSQNAGDRFSLSGIKKIATGTLDIR